MSFTITLEEKAAFLKTIETDTWVLTLWDAMKRRCTDRTVVPGIIQPGDTKEWWHLAEDRLEDAAFAYYITGEDRLGNWLHDVVLSISALSADEWVGPWFRPKTNPPVGQLETAHICAAIAMVLDLCGELFTAEEAAGVKNEVRIKGFEACGRFLDNRTDSQKTNWDMVLLDGYASAAALLGDRDALMRVKNEYKNLEGLYNADSYGELIGYWDYASRKMCHTYEILSRFDPALVEGLGFPYVKCVPWICSSLMFIRPFGGDFGDKPWPRVINYADSNLAYRISGNLALHIARRAQDSHPREAGLARWVFEQMYHHLELVSGEQVPGNTNNFGFYTLIHYPFAAGAITPDEAKLPLVSSYEAGPVIIRDSFSAPRTIVSTMGAYKPLGTANHRHQDLNSFTLAHRDEIFFADPGSCCYRTRTHQFTRSGASHSNWRFLTKDGDWIDQIFVTNENRKNPLCVRRFLETSGSITAVSSDAANAYGPLIKKAERLLVSVLPHALFIIDSIEADTPIKTQANFVVNNRDNKLKYHIAASTKLVLRRNNAAVKLFQSFSRPACDFSFSWTSLHECYHSLPNHLGQGKEGSGMIFTQTSAEFAESHRMVYVILMAEESEIKDWHIFAEEPRVFEVEAPQGLFRVRFKEEPSGFTVTNGETGEALNYSS
jgi:hypothetical protein